MAALFLSLSKHVEGSKKKAGSLNWTFLQEPVNKGLNMFFNRDLKSVFVLINNAIAPLEDEK